MANKHITFKSKAAGSNSFDTHYFKTTAEDVSVDSNNQSLPSGIDSVDELIDELGELAFADDINLPTSDETDSSSSETIATSKAVKTVNDAAMHLAGAEDVTGVKNFTNGIIIGGNVRLYWDSTTSSLKIEEVVQPSPSEEEEEEP